jgi:ABC-type glycerol-3-phosphate transport system substrate-binding protein
MKIQTMIASGNAPDVAALGLEGIGMVAMNDLALPLDDYINAHQEELSEVMGGIDKELLEIFRVDGKLYGIPYEANSVVTHIRKDMFKNAGVELPGSDWTINDLKEISGKISDPDNGVYAFGVPTNFFCLQSLLYSNGAAPLNDDWSAATINSDESVEVFQFLQDAIHKYKWAPEPNDNITDVELIVQGRIAMGWWGRWPTKDYAASELYDTFYFQNVPAWGAGHTTCAVSASYVVMSSTKHPEEAMKVATWAAGREYVNAFMATGSLPANSTFGAEVCANDGVVENWESMYDVYKLGQWRRSQDPPEYADLANIYSKYMDIIYSNQMPAKQALDMAADEINLMLKNSEYRDTAEEMEVIKSLFKN